MPLQEEQKGFTTSACVFQTHVQACMEIKGNWSQIIGRKQTEWEEDWKIIFASKVYK